MMAPDQWCFRQLMRLFVWRYRSTVQHELFRLTEQADSARMWHLRQKLRGMEEGSLLMWGVHITNPENVHLGRHVAIGQGSYLMGAGGITINDFGLLANHTIIITAYDFSEDHAQPVVLGENVWTGSRAIILPGVTIGENAIIGAGAVVSADVPANAIALGVPARVTGEAPQDPEKRREQIERVLNRMNARDDG
jgi:acetyltransferase-like isoleucine patch superfamily enzyme